MSRGAVVALVLVALLGSACAHRPLPSLEGEHEVLQQRERAFLSALGERDLDQTTAYFAEDAVLHVANMPPLQGRPAIARFYGNLFRFLVASESTPERLHVSTGADLAYSVGRVSNAFEGGQGRAEYSGKYLLVWQKREGEWAIVVYSISNNRADGNP
jgi:ketosteroid isomerase-like protein